MSTANGPPCSRPVVTEYYLKLTLPIRIPHSFLLHHPIILLGFSYCQPEQDRQILQDGRQER